MAGTVFSSMKRNYGEYVPAKVSQHGKRDDDEGVFVQFV